LGTLIKWNPAIKSEKDRDGLLSTSWWPNWYYYNRSSHHRREAETLFSIYVGALWCSIPVYYVELYKKGLSLREDSWKDVS
jgi:hypothetical protein